MYPAHIRSDGVQQSLQSHSQTVALYCAEYSAVINMPTCGRLLGLLHDMGKATNNFCEYLCWCVAHPGNFSRRGSVIHSTQGAVYLFSQFGNCESYENLTASLLAMVMLSHHMLLPDCVTLDGRQPLYDKVTAPESLALLDAARTAFFTEVISETECIALFRLAVEELRTYCLFTVRTKDPIWFSHLARFLLSCLSSADCRDTAEFMQDAVPGSDLDMIALNALWLKQAELLDAALSQPKSEKINLIRQRVYQQCAAASAHEPDLFELCVPTGGGKTYSSMRFALGHSARFGKKRIIYIIPYLSILEQNADALRKILTCSIQEFHSGVLQDKADPDTQPVFTEDFSSPVILTTMVQFLNAFFSGSRAALRRLHQFSDAVLIFDEIQSLPLRCVHLFNSAIDFLRSACNTTVVLCSATQPLLFQTQSHPLNQGRPPVTMVADTEELFALLKRTRVLSVQNKFSLLELTTFTLEKLEETGGVLVILNTRRDALACYGALKKAAPSNTHLFHLSTSMCPEHRRAVLNEIHRSASAQESFLCVSTQLIEAGVDLSCPCVIRALAGTDSIAQAAGRCNRNGEAGCRDVYVIRLQSENLSRLPDIATAQEAAERVMHAYDDILCRAAIDRYYLHYFKRNESLMDYPLKGGGRSICDLLSDNLAGCGALGRAPSLPFTQAFEEASRNFSVIESQTQTALVPYADGAELINALLSERSPNGTRELFLKAQQFSVGLFSWQAKKLESLHSLHETPQGILYIDKSYYDSETGLVTDEQKLPFLNA